MKKFKFFTLLGAILVSTSLVGCGSNNNDNNGEFIIEDITAESDAVISYNDNLVDFASKCLASEDTIWDTYDDANSNTQDILNAISDTISECNTSINNINSLGNREGDSSLKDGVLSIIEKTINYYTKFGELLPYLEKEELTDEESELYNSIYSELETLDSELANANDDLMTIQEQFAKNHGFELETDEE